MFKESTDQKFIKMVKTITENPGASEYRVAQVAHVNRITLLRKIKEQYKLEERHLIRLEPGKRDAHNIWLTYSGLIYAIQIGALKTSQAHDVRLKHKVELPIILEDKSRIQSLVQSLNVEMERNFPENFYRWVHLGPNFDDSKTQFLPLFAGILAFADLLKTRPLTIKKYIKGKDIVLPDGTVLDDYPQIFRLLMQFIPGP